MKNEWIDWYGGLCPVAEGTFVDVEYRNGLIETYSDGMDLSWTHLHMDNHDIIAWRLHQSEQEVWSGEGLPPVGCECEVRRAIDWMPCKILFISDYHVIIQSEEEICWQTQACQFRPIRTEAERKRDETVSLIMSWMHHAGRAEIELIYDFIAAGEIPGIRLE